jgi:exosortase family protein XrtM
MDWSVNFTQTSLNLYRLTGYPKDSLSMHSPNVVAINQPTIKSLLWFLLVFIVMFGVFEFLYFQIPDHLLRDVIYHYGLVLPCITVIQFVDSQQAVVALHNTLVTPKVTLEVVRGCDGAGALFLLMSAVMAFSASFKQKLYGLIIGIAFLMLVNWLRILVLYAIAVYQQNWFNLIHSYFAPSLIIILGCLFFLSWTEWVNRSRR